MKLFRSLLADDKGAVLPLLATCLFVLILITAVTVESARVYTVQNRIQQASDAALLGAVSSNANVPFAAEYDRLFNANFAAIATSLNVSYVVTTPVETSPGVYDVSVRATVPLLFGSIVAMPTSSFSIESQVTRGYTNIPAGAGKLELTFAIDQSTSMRSVRGATLQSYLTAIASVIRTDIFNNQASSENITISVVPFDERVNMGTRARFDRFAKTSGLTPAQYAGFQTVTSNGQPDFSLMYRPSGEVSDDYITSDQATRFLIPGIETMPNPGTNTITPAIMRTGPGAGAVAVQYYNAYQPANPLYLNPLVPLSTGMNSSAAVTAALSNLQPASTNATGTQLNVGLAWGWYTLSPKWRNQWDVSGYPADYSYDTQKVLVIISDGHNWASYDGAGSSLEANSPGGMDGASFIERHNQLDNKTMQLCDNIKAAGPDNSRRIKIYALALPTTGGNRMGDDGSGVSGILRYCSSGSAFYFTPGNAGEMTSAIRNITNAINYVTLRITK